jgi:allantoate deiminase/N-carbamoyl-L-amino-acid hydrolase
MSTTTTTDQVASLTVDVQRLETLIGRFAGLTEPGAGDGVTRLAFSPREGQAHSEFAAYMEALGLSVATDAAGNTIAELSGREPGLRALGTGSHLDSVPNGGAFDGIAGVVAAMEVARMFLAGGIRPRHPLRFVAFAAEEGARFGQACTGSRIAAGLISADELGALRDKDGVTAAEAMSAVGLRPHDVATAKWNPSDWAAFVELHIEQGSVLTGAGIPVGVVDLISGSTRFAIDLKGRAAHTGGTPMHLRADALAAAAEIVLAAEDLARDSQHHGTRITVGRLEVEPGSITTIAGHTRLHVDIRDIDGPRQRQSATDLIAAAHRIAEKRGIGIQTSLLGDASPVVLPMAIREAITRTAQQLQTAYRVMPSGASHDAQMVNHICPTGMIFVPSLNCGASHSPEELTDYSELARGVELLAATLLRLDEH